MTGHTHSRNDVTKQEQGLKPTDNHMSVKDVYMLMIETTLAKKIAPRPIDPSVHLSGPLGLLGGLDGGVVLLLLGGVLGELGLVLGNRLLLALGLPLLERSEVSGPLESLGSNESLDGRGLGVGLSGFSGDLTSRKTSVQV